MYWEKDIETLDRANLRRYQLERINWTLRQSRKSKYYSGRRIDDVNSIEQIETLPFTTKDDLREQFPYGFLAVPLEQVVRLHSSSGTTGNPTVVFHTLEDIDAWKNLIARSMFAVGVRKHDVFQNMMGYGLFTGGIGFHYGAERLGVLTIPTGPGNSKRQIWFLKHLRTSVIHVLPSYALRLFTYFDELKIDPQKDLNLRIALIGAEPHSEGIRKKIERLYGLKAYNSYGLSEVCGPGVAFECGFQTGLHLWEDHFYPEIIDSESGQVLPDGEEGELVLTTLRRQAMPLIRYRTRDLTRLIPGNCPCGRNHRRIDRIKGRSDDMLIINGVNIFPIQIERTLMELPDIGNNYLIEISKSKFMDELLVKVEVKENVFQGTLSELERLKVSVTKELKLEIGITPNVKLVEAASLPATDGKAKRVYDLRTN
ncbi:MAG TPA: phenylacetate--CoA ligase [bacterium]|nr:phenylacetate--CoA ligase [bacterium]